MNTIVIPSERLLAERRALRLHAQGLGLFSRVEAVIVSDRDDTQVLVPPRRGGEDSPAKPLLLLYSTSVAGASAELLPAAAVGLLVVGEGPELGRVKGWVRTADGTIAPLDELILPGPGLPKIDLRHGGDTTDETRNAIFSRVEGALSPATFHSLRRVIIVCNGAGRLNSCLATVLARDGIPRFVLIDPDRYELHNGGGGLAGGPSAVGLPKTRVLGDALRAIDPAIVVEEVPRSITHWRALQAVLGANALLSAADHDAARLAAGILACLFNKVLLDVGVGIFHENGRRRMAGDIRLIWPGRCLLCTGGVRAPEEAIRELSSAEAERLVHEHPLDWSQQRAGSLASLNATMAGVAARILEDFVGGRLTENGFWLRVEFEEQGRLHVTYPQPPPVLRCLCQWAAQGNAALQPALKSLRRLLMP